MNDDYLSNVDRIGLTSTSSNVISFNKASEHSENVDSEMNVIVSEHHEPEQQVQQDQSAASLDVVNNLFESSSISSSSVCEMKMDEETMSSSSCGLAAGITNETAITTTEETTTTATTGTSATVATVPNVVCSDDDSSAMVLAPKTNENSPILNLREILQLFGCAISQEQAWAVLYQVLTKLKHLLDTNLSRVHINQHRIDINLLNFAKDGTLFFDFENDDEQDDDRRVCPQDSDCPNDSGTEA